MESTYQELIDFTIKLSSLKSFFNDPQFIEFLKKMVENNTDKLKECSQSETEFAENYMKFLHTSAAELKNVEEPPHFLKLKRMYMEGCFDIVHSGHYNALRQAKALTEVLVVGVVSDEETILNKGPPIMNLAERACLIRACKWVDEVIEGVEYNPTIEQLDKFNCQYNCHGDDIPLDHNGMETNCEIRLANRLKIIKRTEGISTTDIVGRLLLMTREHHFSADMNKELGGKLSKEYIEASEIRIQNSKDSNADNKKDPETNYESNLPEVKIMSTTRRIRDFSTARKIQSEDVVVYIDGAFDLLHPGHIELLEKAKSFGTYLIVGLHSDEIVHKRKNFNFPILNIQERTLNILALRCVDEVLISAPGSVTENLVKNFGIKHVIKGEVYSYFEFDSDPYEFPKSQGIFREVVSNFHFTTEDLIERLQANRKKYIELQKKKEVKLQDYYINMKADITNEL